MNRINNYFYTMEKKPKHSEIFGKQFTSIIFKKTLLNAANLLDKAVKLTESHKAVRLTTIVRELKHLAGEG